MNLYIETENGVTKNHPAYEENLIEAFGAIPEHWETFVRVERPIPTVYQILDSQDSVYEKVNDVWTDVWPLRDMTAEEKATKQQNVRNFFNSRPQAENWSAWTLDEATCIMMPPIPRPTVDQTKLDAGIMTYWCGAESNWKDTPSRPVDNNQYEFDFFAWQWVQVVN
jgi:hypothetical protein